VKNATTSDGKRGSGYSCSTNVNRSLSVAVNQAANADGGVGRAHADGVARVVTAGAAGTGTVGVGLELTSADDGEFAGVTGCVVAGADAKVVVDAESNINQPTPPTAITAAAAMTSVLEAMQEAPIRKGEGMDLADATQGPSTPYFEKQSEKIH
jgi:hypothetical protein